MSQVDDATSERGQGSASDLFEEAPIGYLVLDAAGHIVKANRRAAKTLQRPLDELIGRALAEFCPDTPLARVKAMIVGWHWPSREPLHHEDIQIRLPDGEPRWMRITVDPVYDEVGRVTATRMLVEDLFEEMASATGLRRASVRFRVAFENAPVGMHLSTTEGRFLEVNAALCHMLGYSESQLLTKQVWDVVHPDDLEVFASARDSLFGGHQIEVDSRFLRADGSVRWCRLNAVLPGGPEGYLVSQVSDITDLVELRQRLEGMLKDKDRFIATVSHELRTPLTGVLGFASELRDGLPRLTSTEIVEFASLIAQGCAAASDLVEDLLVAARLDTADIDLSPEPVDLYPEALSVKSSPEIASVINSRVLTITGERAVAQADAPRVRQIMRHLVSNAARYGGSRITIVVGTQPDTGEAFVRVMDDGPGIPQPLQEVLFLPYQHGAQEGGRTQSVGLGLYLSRQLAQLMGGELSYRREDDATVFELTLPLSGEAEGRRG